MINLISDEAKENIRFARRNTALLKWVIGLSFGVLGILIINLAGGLFLNSAISNTNTLVQGTQTQLKDQKLDQVKQQVGDISNNLKLMVTVLSREVLYSKLLQQIGSVLPSGAVLTGLNLVQNAAGLDMEAGTISYQTATQVQLNLQDPNNKLFSKADIVSIQCDAKSLLTKGSFTSAYPCKAELRAQFVNNNPFLFINLNSSKPGITR